MRPIVRCPGQPSGAVGLVLWIVFSSCRGGAAPEGKPRFVPTSHYEEKQIEGWTVRVNRDLLGAERALGDRALRLLAAKLYDVTRAVPPKAVEVLRGIPIWLGVDDGVSPCAEYHGSADWLRDHGHNPDKANAVEIGNAARFLDWTQSQPSMILHELAHGYFDRLPAAAQAPIRDAFAEANRLGTYESVLHAGGGKVRHYALSSVTEFFAEGSEAFLGTNDHYPFVRAELHEHHPALALALAEAWSHHERGGHGLPHGGQRAVTVRPWRAGEVPQRSPQTTRPLELSVVNATREELRFAWVDFDGRQREGLLLAAGDRQLIQTYEGHTFVILRRGRPVAFLVMPSESGRATITDGTLAP
jgi:hypothetical protein